MEIQQKHDGKRKDIDRLSEKEKALYATFQASLGENNKFAEFLNKVFKKKIKRAKKKAQNEEGNIINNLIDLILSNIKGPL